jgi:hypothetical protein
MCASAAIDTGAQRFNGCPFAAYAGVAEVILRPHARRILGRSFLLVSLAEVVAGDVADLNTLRGFAHPRPAGK